MRRNQSLNTILIMSTRLSVMSTQIIQQVKYFQIDQFQVYFHDITLFCLQNNMENISEIFRDLPEKMSDTLFPPSSGIRIEETMPSHKEIPSFSNFFDSEKYIDNPFGKDFIKLEIDVDRFSTNKTSMIMILFIHSLYFILIL